MGIIYLVQPAELIGTNRYKVGCSHDSSLTRIIKGYRQGTRYLLISETEIPFEIEKQIKDTFNTYFTLIAGSEYFEGDECIMKEMFVNIITKSFYSVNKWRENMPYVVEINKDTRELYYINRGYQYINIGTKLNPHNWTNNERIYLYNDDTRPWDNNIYKSQYIEKLLSFDNYIKLNNYDSAYLK
jgi:hypothetical protein